MQRLQNSVENICMRVTLVSNFFCLDFCVWLLIDNDVNVRLT